MTQDLTGIDYLKENEIRNMRCNEKEPYAFISYSHDEYDSRIVKNVFRALYNRGINIWIDTANMPLNEESWKKSAKKALRDKNCRFAFFFRSESSMVKETIADELKTMKELDHVGRIVVIDIWHDSHNSAEKFHKDILNNGNDDSCDICDEICDYVSTECKAIRFNVDMGNDINNLVNEMIDVAKEHGVTPHTSADETWEDIDWDSGFLLSDEDFQSAEPSLDFPDDECITLTKEINRTDAQYKICTLGAKCSIGCGELVTVQYGDKTYEGKMHSTCKGRIDRMSRFYSENGIREGDSFRVKCLQDQNRLVFIKQ